MRSTVNFGGTCSKVKYVLYADVLAKNAKSGTKCKGTWIECHKHVTTLTLQSARKDRGSTSANTWKAVHRTNHHCDSQKLQVVDKFIYLGSTLSRAVHIDDEVTARTGKTSVAFGRLRTNVLERNGIRLDTKLKVYKAVVLSTLLYACETWTVIPRDLTISTY